MPEIGSEDPVEANREYKEKNYKSTDPSSIRRVSRREGMGDERSRANFVRIWADKDERSLIRLAPEVVQRKMLELPETLRTMSEAEMKHQFGKQITPTWKQIRLSFWFEYDRVQREWQNKMESRAIVAGICAEEYWYRLLKLQEFVAFLITPPTQYTIRMQEAVSYGFERLREILDLPLIDEAGKAIPRNADLILKTTLALDMRHNGAVAQKLQIENKTISMSLKGSVQDSEAAAQHMTMEELEKQITRLQREQDRALLHGAKEPNVDFPDMIKQTNVVEAEVVSAETVAMDGSVSETGSHGGDKF